MYQNLFGVPIKERVLQIDEIAIDGGDEYFFGLVFRIFVGGHA